jgi:hypothetical protein
VGIGRKKRKAVSIISNVSKEKEKNRRQRQEKENPVRIFVTTILIRSKTVYTEILTPCNILCKYSFVTSTPEAWIECIETSREQTKTLSHRQTDSRHNHPKVITIEFY